MSTQFSDIKIEMVEDTTSNSDENSRDEESHLPDLPKEGEQPVEMLNLDETLLVMSINGVTYEGFQGYLEVTRILVQKGLSITLSKSAMLLKQMSVVSQLSLTQKEEQLRLLRQQDILITQVLETYMQKERLSFCCYSPSANKVFISDPTCQRFATNLKTVEYAHKDKINYLRSNMFVVAMATTISQSKSMEEDFKAWCGRSVVQNIFAIDLQEIDWSLEGLLEDSRIANGTLKTAHPVPLSILGTTVDSNSGRAHILGAAVVSTICGGHAVIFSDKQKDQRHMTPFYNTVYGEPGMVYMPLVLGANGTLGDMRTNDAIVNTFYNKVEGDVVNHITLEGLEEFPSDRYWELPGVGNERHKDYEKNEDSPTREVLEKLYKKGKAGIVVGQERMMFYRCVLSGNSEASTLEKRLGIYRVGINDFASIKANYPSLFRKYIFILIDPLSQYTMAIPKSWIMHQGVMDGVRATVDLGKSIPGIGVIIYEGISPRLGQICSVFTASLYMLLTRNIKKKVLDYPTLKEIQKQYRLFGCVKEGSDLTDKFVTRMYGLVRLDLDPIWGLSPRDWGSRVANEFLSSIKLSKITQYDYDESESTDDFYDYTRNLNADESGDNREGLPPDSVGENH